VQRRSTRRSRRTCSTQSTPTCSTATSAGEPADADRRTFEWDDDSTYVRKPPYFDGMGLEPEPVTDIRARACWRCSATRSRPTTSPRPGRSRRHARPAQYLDSHGVEPQGLQLATGRGAATTR
jgi:aconitase A